MIVHMSDEGGIMVSTDVGEGTESTFGYMYAAATLSIRRLCPNIFFERISTVASRREAFPT